MPNWFRLALSLLQFRVSLHSSSVSSTVDVPDKRIAIVGGGTGGIVTLKTLVDDLPKDLTQTWEIVLFEQRDDVGGIWYPDPHTPHPPDLPESPLYSRLRTNTPHPSMTIPRFPTPSPPGTALFPDHTFVHQYQKSMILRWDLSSYIRLRHEVLAADWHGDNVSGHCSRQIRSFHCRNWTFSLSLRTLSFVAHALADPAHLPPPPALLADLRAQEAALDNPARIGHRIVRPGGGACVSGRARRDPPGSCARGRRCSCPAARGSPSPGASLDDAPAQSVG
ncbi:hypothetical protein EDB92DRAFT_1840960 [Lactarius akahatsu]|uniref:FAD/NAD(P)-binding domain-containing protein n=1 Tax=Lactarius akahatsu TaxID=416441 RepID=A0AAD4LKK0_9AGAM|nr:hypothetical protein EDB92DRAFT_1840960 [Lactarius akahatsu]